MFSKPKQTPATAPTPMRNRDAAGGTGTFSIIGADVRVKGDIEASVDLHIDGQVEGDVHCAALVQGAGSLITGGVVAQSAKLGGRVEGSIDAVDLVIEAGAEIQGDVTYTNLTVANGSKVEGAFRHKSSAAQRPEPAAKAPEASNVEPITPAKDIGALRA